jgi:acyl-CoA reductase-like NAD-dependent aldehyde dehydrogenase
VFSGPLYEQVTQQLTKKGRNEDDTLAAIDSAKQAFSTFQHTHPNARARILRKWYDLMVTNRRQLATILMYENGRPITGALQEIDYAASFLD